MPYLKYPNIWQAIRSITTPVDLNVLQPLDVGLRVTEDLTNKLYVATHHSSAICWKARL